jgi:hypothetical protein
MIPPEMSDERPSLPTSLLDRLRADPLRAPETIALAAAERHGPAAREWEATQRARYVRDSEELARAAKRSHASYARFGGAAMGVGGFVTVLPDLASLAWIQSRMVFFIAAAYGFDPTDPMRPAELLVLQELYDTPAAAREGLDGAGQSLASAMIDRRTNADDAMIARLTKMVGKAGAKRVAGRLIPGFAVLFNAVTNERDTRALADRAIRFYGG